MAIKIHEIKDIILVTRNSFLFQSIQRNTRVINPKEINFTPQKHFKTSHNSSNQLNQKSEFSCVASFKLYLPIKNSILILLKPMIIHQYKDHFLIIVDLENFEIP